MQLFTYPKLMGHIKTSQIQVFTSDQGWVKETIHTTGRMKPHLCGTTCESKTHHQCKILCATYTRTKWMVLNMRW